jgi:hypothetical protein
MSNVKRLMLLSERIALIQAEAVGRDLSQWEKDRLSDWKQLAWGSPKQNTIVDNIGQRLGLDFTVNDD